MKSTKNELSIKEKLLRTGLILFSEYGYDATSTRMIAKEAGVTRSSIAFYFETKEAYYNAVMEHALETVHNFLNPLFEEIMEAYENDAISSDNAPEYISRLLKMQIDWFYNEKYSTIVKLIMKEQSSVGHTDMFYSILYEKSVELLAKLIMTATGIEDKDKALILSMSLNGTIQSMGEHKSFTYKMFELDDPDRRELFLEKLILMTDSNIKMILDNFKK